MASRALVAAVLNMPIPITNPTTIMVKLKRLIFCFDCISIALWL